MAKTCVGIDIGAGQLKLAVCSDGVPRRLVAENMPDSLVKEGRIVSPEAMAGFIKETASKAKISSRACAVILPASLAFTRTMSIPAMTREHLELNLPYEFRDFISQEKDKYFYDYAVTETRYDEEGNHHELDLIAAATLKETIADYSEMFRRAGFKLITAIPEELSYMNIIRRFESKSGDSGGREYCFIDLGHTATKLHIFKGIKHQATRVMELSAQMLDLAIADKYGVDKYIARELKHENANNELFDQVCMSIYTQISIEVMRAINFYRFNSPESNLNEVFLCGGGARVEPLVKQLAADIDMSLHKADELLPESGKSADVLVCHTAIGATMQ